MWPLISPASSAWVSFILALMSEWPVFHMMGLPPRAARSSYMSCEHFTSPMKVAPGLRRQDFAGVKNHQLVAVEDGAALVDRADAVGVAVEGDAQIRAGFAHLGDQRLQVARARWGRDDGWGSGRPSRRTFRWRPRSAVPGCGASPGRRCRCRHRTPRGSGAGSGTATATSSTYGVTTSAVVSQPAPLSQIAGFDHAAQFLNGLAVDGGSAANGLEAVELGRIVAAGDHHAAVGLQDE